MKAFGYILITIASLLFIKRRRERKAQKAAQQAQPDSFNTTFTTPTDVQNNGSYNTTPTPTNVSGNPTQTPTPSSTTNNKRRDNGIGPLDGFQ